MDRLTTPSIVISIDDQSLHLVENGIATATYPVSTSAKGMGFREGSYRTPTGRFEISEKIGADQSPHTIFRARIPVGTWDGSATSEDLILGRILRLNGLDPQNQNTLDRHIYIHGTNHGSEIGHPGSHGCIRMTIHDMLDLFDRTPVGTLVEIQPSTIPRGRLCFMDCDSTLSTIEGIDELARARGPEVLAKVVALTDAAMNGEIPIAEVFPRRMDMIRPDRALCDAIAKQYIETMVEGADTLVAELHEAGWTPVILSGGFAPLIQPLATRLGIRHVEAVPLFFHDDGSYAGYDEKYPTTRNNGKNEIIHEWKQAVIPTHTVMIGDGVSDLETKPDVDLFIGFGGVVQRPKVQSGADFWLKDMHDRSSLWERLGSMN